MASRRVELTTSEKASRVAEVASWLTNATKGAEVPRSYAKRVDRAFDALSGIIPESFARNQICAFLKMVAEHPETWPDPLSTIRAFTTAIRSGHEYGGPGEHIALTDAAIITAIDAWKRRQGQPAKGAPDKWKATLALLQQAGLAENIDADALRKGWERRPR